MENQSLAQKAGKMGMAGAVLWFIGVFINYGVPGSQNGPLNLLYQIAGEVAQICFIFAIFGLIWGGAVRSRFGVAAVALFSLGNVLIGLAWLRVTLTGAGYVLFQLAACCLPWG
jgi:hypothetical protein